MDQKITIEKVEEEGVQLFVNSFTHVLDGKRRLTIPTQWRNSARTESFFILPSFEANACFLMVMTAKELARRSKVMNEKWALLPREKRSRLRREFFGESCEAQVDAQGRIRVDDRLLDRIGVKTQTQLVGAGRYFELWSFELWNEKSTQTGPSGYDSEIADFIDC